MLQHGYILNDMAMIPVNIFAFALNLIYLAIFYKYHENKVSFSFNVFLCLVQSPAIILYCCIIDTLICCYFYLYCICCFLKVCWFIWIPVFSLIFFKSSFSTLIVLFIFMNLFVIRILNLEQIIVRQTLKNYFIGFISSIPIIYSSNAQWNLPCYWFYILNILITYWVPLYITILELSSRSVWKNFFNYLYLITLLLK